MSDHQSLIQAFRTVLGKFHPQGEFSFPEEFAIKRFQKKYQEPDPSLSRSLHENCWDSWIEFDNQLPKSREYFFRVFQKNPRFWYKIRWLLSEKLHRISLRGDVNFSPGSTFTATRGRNSIESKLSAIPWDCTIDNFDNFAKVCYRHNALKKAARRRWNAYLRRKGWDGREVDFLLYSHFSRHSRGRIGFDIFCWKLRHIVEFQHGSRFSSVPKNNEVRRPINIEPFCNVVVQRLIGDNLRQQLRHCQGIDLDTLADTHRLRLRDANIATIDLKNASDSISIELCRFLLPEHIFNMLMVSRSPMILGNDDCYHLVNKISAMGNGFTFELMSLMLTFICRELDPSSSVFGDDIIISKTKAPILMELLEDIGFIVNKEKSFIDGPFRESCGGNYHDDFGYIESFDFLYPENIHDCVVTYNKVRRLSYFYDSFKFLEVNLYRHIPIALRGADDNDLKGETPIRLLSAGLHTEPALILSNYFRTGFRKDKMSALPPSNRCLQACKALQIPFNRLIIGFSEVIDERSHTYQHLPSRLYGKYLMYLHAGRRAKDVVTGSVRWVDCYYVVADSRTFRLRSLLQSLP